MTIKCKSARKYNIIRFLKIVFSSWYCTWDFGKMQDGVTEGYIDAVPVKVAAHGPYGAEFNVLYRGKF